MQLWNADKNLSQRPRYGVLNMFEVKDVRKRNMNLRAEMESWKIKTAVKSDKCEINLTNVMSN